MDEKIIRQWMALDIRDLETEIVDLRERVKELEEGIEKHCRDNKISSLEHDGTYSTAKCRGWNKLYELVEKESK